MKQTLIFSDVHLHADSLDRKRQEQFNQFLRRIDSEHFDRVICLGDLFDFWFEYRHVIFSGYFQTLRALAELREAGIELHLVCGNHDFWAGRFLEDELGMHIHRAGITLPFGDSRAYFHHGDGINPTDRGYRIYKRFARNRWVIRAFRLLHPDWAMGLAQRVSHGSRSMLGVKNPAEGPEAQALRQHAHALLQQGEADAVFFGHAHAPHHDQVATPQGTGHYFNTGDWLSHRSYVVWDGKEFSLRYEDAGDTTSLDGDSRSGSRL